MPAPRSKRLLLKLGGGVLAGGAGFGIDAGCVNALAEGMAEVPAKCIQVGLVIGGGQVHTPQAVIQAHNDHRIAMTFAVMGLRVPGVVIEGAESVAKSFPTFWEVFETLGESTE